jgi:FkbM family methyltransferase
MQPICNPEQDSSVRNLDVSHTSVFGFVLPVLNGTHWAWKYRVLGEDYELFQRPAYLSGFQKQGVFLDIGANCGFYTLMSQAYSDHRIVFSFEPSPPNMACLIEAIWKNGLVNCTPVMAFASDHSGFGGMARSGPACSMMIPGGKTTPCVVVDELNLDKVGFVKIDVEGMECHVLRGMATTIKKDRPEMIVEVCESNLNYFGESVSRLVSLLLDLGYGLFDVYDYEHSRVIKVSEPGRLGKELESTGYGCDLRCIS